MLDKIKDLMKTKEEIDKINLSIEETKQAMSSFKKEFTEVKKELDQIKISQKEFLETFKENLNIIKDSSSDLKNSIYDFNLLKNKLQNQIVEKFEEQLKNELNLNLENLKKDIENYNALKTNVEQILVKTKNLSLEIDKLTEISRSIKKEDFELTRYANQLASADKEKLDLMKKIDVLENLISKMRRSRP